MQEINISMLWNTFCRSKQNNVKVRFRDVFCKEQGNKKQLKGVSHQIIHENDTVIMEIERYSFLG